MVGYGVYVSVGRLVCVGSMIVNAVVFAVADGAMYALTTCVGVGVDARGEGVAGSVGATRAASDVGTVTGSDVAVGVALDVGLAGSGVAVSAGWRMAAGTTSS